LAANLSDTVLSIRILCL